MGELDFIVTGVARSGTTAFSRYLNSIAGITCGLEYFSVNFDHSTIKSPAFFEGDKYKKNPFGRDIVARSLEQNVNEKAVFGNKIPNYFYHLSKIMGSIRGDTIFYCYRDPQKCVRSANKRANNPNDPWESSRTGIFCILDYMICLRNMIENKNNIYVISHEYMTKEPDSLLSEIAEVLDVTQPKKIDETEVNRLKMAATRVGKSSEKLPLSESEQRLLDHLPYEEINRIMNKKRVFRFDEVHSEIKTKIDESTSHFIELFEIELCETSLSREKQFYFQFYKKRFGI